MRRVRNYAILALVGFGAGLLLIQPPTTPLSAAHAYVPNVPLMAVYENRSANPDGSKVSTSTYLVAVRKDGSRAIIWTMRVGHCWVQTRMIYDPATQTRIDIHDNLGIKTTWSRQPFDSKTIIVSSCSPLPEGETIEVLGYKAVQDWHLVDTNRAGNQSIVVNGWRIPELGCLRATTAIQSRQKEQGVLHGPYARNAEDRLLWLFLTDPPDSLFAVSDQLEEVSPQKNSSVMSGLDCSANPNPSTPHGS